MVERAQLAAVPGYSRPSRSRVRRARPAGVRGRRSWAAAGDVGHRAARVPTGTVAPMRHLEIAGPRAGPSSTAIPDGLVGRRSTAPSDAAHAADAARTRARRGRRPGRRAGPPVGAARRADGRRRRRASARARAWSGRCTSCGGPCPSTSRGRSTSRPVRRRARTRTPGWRSTTAPSRGTPSRAAGPRRPASERMAEPWFDPDGFLLHEERRPAAPASAGRRCTATSSPPLGEIYVIAVDPAAGRHGLGRPLTLAGLDHLHRQGSAWGCSTSTAPTTPRSALYDRLGFTVHHTDVAARSRSAAR